jgi:predicted transcriptional regulator
MPAAQTSLKVGEEVLLVTVRGYAARHGVPASQRELARIVGRSPTLVNRMLRRLVAKGLLRSVKRMYVPVPVKDGDGEVKEGTA